MCPAKHLPPVENGQCLVRKEDEAIHGVFRRSSRGTGTCKVYRNSRRLVKTYWREVCNNVQALVGVGSTDNWTPRTDPCTPTILKCKTLGWPVSKQP